MKSGSKAIGDIANNKTQKFLLQEEQNEI